MEKAIKTLIILILLMLTIYMCKWFIKTDYFNIKEVEIIGEYDNLIKNDIISKLEDLKNKNIVYLDTSEIEKKLSQDARIKKISILKVFPSKLKIELEERKPHAYVRKDGEILIADEELNIFGYISELEPKNLPIVDYVDEESMKDLKIIVSKIKNQDFYSTISEIKKSSKKEADVYEIILMSGTTIETDTLVSSEKYSEIPKLYEKIKNEQEVEFMNIRFKDVFFK